MRKPFKQTTQTIAKLIDGKLRIEKRNKAPILYARAYLQGKNRVFRTGETSLLLAKRVATEWYLDLRRKVDRLEPLDAPMFDDVVADFIRDAELKGEVGAEQLASYKFKWSALKPYFQGVKIADVTTEFLEGLREKRSKRVTLRKTPLKPSTLKKDMMFCSKVLRYAHAAPRQHIEHLPLIPSFKGQRFQVLAAPRPFLDRDQYMALQKLAKARTEEVRSLPRVHRQRQETYWFLQLCVGAALRVGEAYSLRWCDCRLEKLTGRNGRAAEAIRLEVLGKHSKGGQRELAYGFFGAVHAFKEMREARPQARPDEPLFVERHRDGINELLEAAGLKTDPRTGRTRDTKSLRPTAISLRLELGDNLDIRDIAKWARTSSAMIEKFYDQNHPENSAARVMAFRPDPPRLRESQSSRKRKPVDG